MSQVQILDEAVHFVLMSLRKDMNPFLFPTKDKLIGQN